MKQIQSQISQLFSWFYRRREVYFTFLQKYVFSILCVSVFTVFLLLLVNKTLLKKTPLGSILALKACAFSGKYLKMIGNAHERWAIMRRKTFSLLFVCVCSCNWRYFHIWTKILVFTCRRMLFKQYIPRDFTLGEESAWNSYSFPFSCLQNGTEFHTSVLFLFSSHLWSTMSQCSRLSLTFKTKRSRSWRRGERSVTLQELWLKDVILKTGAMDNN